MLRIRPTTIALVAATLLVATAPLAGCGSSMSTTASGPELALERTQLVQVSAGLRSTEAAVRREVSASRAAWPAIASGLPQAPTPALRAAVSAASASAGALPEPAFMASSARLTGPAAGIAGIYENYDRLAERGWRLTDASIASIATAPPAVASFARENSSLYIDAIYDGHYDLSLLGKSLMSAYEKLGGRQAFGATLTPIKVINIALGYSIEAVRLEPHPSGAAREG
jgi:hypothetical protein